MNNSSYNVESISKFGNKHLNMDIDVPSTYIDRRLGSLYTHIDVQFIQRELCRRLPQSYRKNLNVLDVGAGKGRITRHLAEIAEHCVAIEPFPNYCQELKKYCCMTNVDIRQLDLRGYQKVCTHKFDIVYVSGVVLYVSDDEVVDFFKIIHDLLHPHGLLLIRDWGVENNYFGSEPYGSITYDSVLEIARPPEGIMKIAQEAGFKCNTWRRAYPRGLWSLSHLKFLKYLWKVLSTKPMYPLFNIFAKFNVPYHERGFFDYSFALNDIE